MLSPEQRQSLTETAQRYAANINRETASYLQSRGVTKEAAQDFLLGTVIDPAPGHEPAEGCLAIPYRSPAGVTAVKFRRVDGGTPKYLWPVGQKVGLYNVVDLHTGSDIIAICEGEIDTLIMSAMVGIPAVGVAGVSQWKPWFPKIFDGFTRVLVFADNDVKDDPARNPGMELAKKIKDDLDQATIVNLPPNMDVNDVFLAHGAAWFRQKVDAA